MHEFPCSARHRCWDLPEWCMESSLCCLTMYSAWFTCQSTRWRFDMTWLDLSLLEFWSFFKALLRFLMCSHYHCFATWYWQKQVGLRERTQTGGGSCDRFASISQADEITCVYMCSLSILICSYLFVDGYLMLVMWQSVRKSLWGVSPGSNGSTETGCRGAEIFDQNKSLEISARSLHSIRKPEELESAWRTFKSYSCMKYDRKNVCTYIYI